jgi:2-hydroxy-6-oxonona-2,4-dienedioate hydrolase
MKSKKLNFRWAIGAAAALAGAWTYLRYRRDLRAARERVRAGGRVVETACGTIEYGESGDGPPILAIHGASGGYDQALFLGRAILGESYRIIAPSRFGYLKTPIPEDCSIEAQADAYACLLDALDVDRAVVIAISAGGPSGLHFALRHPGRTAALVTVSAITYGGVPEAEVRWDRTRHNRAMRSDWVYWLDLNVVRSPLLERLGVSPLARAGLAPAERAAAEQLLATALPLSDRLPGTTLDQQRDLPPDAPWGQIRAPTLVIHARDDPLVGYAHAEHAASCIPGAELMAFEQGGHYLLGHYDQIRARLLAFLSENGTPRTGELDKMQKTL